MIVTFECKMRACSVKIQSLKLWSDIRYFPTIFSKRPTNYISLCSDILSDHLKSMLSYTSHTNIVPIEITKINSPQGRASELQASKYTSQFYHL